MNAKRSTPRQAAAKAVEKATGIAPADQANQNAAANHAAGDATTATGTAPATPASIETLLGSSILPSLIEIGEDNIQLGEIVAAAHQASGLSVDDWNALNSDDRELRLQAEIDRRRAELVKPAEAPGRPFAAELAAGLAALDDGIGEMVSSLRVMHSEGGVAEAAGYIASVRVGIARMDAALASLEVEFGIAAPAAVIKVLPAEVPEGKVRVRVRGPQAGRRRLGRHFTAEAQDIDVTADELAALSADSALTVREIGFQD